MRTGFRAPARSGTPIRESGRHLGSVRRRDTFGEWSVEPSGSRLPSGREPDYLTTSRERRVTPPLYRCVQSVNPKFFPAIVVVGTGKLVA